jgi:hypothetical protein
MAHCEAGHGQLDEKDPCGSWGKDQKWALVWFVSVIIFGTFLTCTLSKIDSWMFYNDDLVDVAGVKLIDNDKYRDNRKASFSIPSERSDMRARGSYTRAVDTLSQ